jgi:Rrf2 family nitric oxide-sensitive transcriptional repressor
MRLNLQTDFALRTLLYLSSHPDDLSTITEIAGAYHISRNHLVKVAHRLVKLGFIEGVRGHAGGLRLARPATMINVGDVVRKVEPDFDLVECFEPATNSCVVSRDCALKAPLREARNAFLAALDRYTLADLVAVPGMARQLIRLRA